MYYSDMIDNLTTMLEDKEQLTFTDTNLVDSLQDGADEIAIETLLIDKMVEIYPPINTAYWRIRDDIADYFAPIAVYDPNRNIWFSIVTYKNLESRHYSWDTCVGETEILCPLDFNQIALYPLLTAQPTQRWKFYYKAIAPVVTSDSEVFLNDKQSMALFNYVMADMLDIALEHTKSQYYFAKYIGETADIKEDVRRAGTSTQMRIMGAQYGTVD